MASATRDPDRSGDRTVSWIRATAYDGIDGWDSDSAEPDVRARGGRTVRCTVLRRTVSEDPPLAEGFLRIVRTSPFVTARRGLAAGPEPVGEDTRGFPHTAGFREGPSSRPEGPEAAASPVRVDPHS